jgi:hypothetical protein
MMLKRSMHSVHAKDQDIVRSSGQEAGPTTTGEIGRVIVDRGFMVTISHHIEAK